LGGHLLDPVFHDSHDVPPKKYSMRERVEMYLVEVDDGLPEVVLLLVEVSHTNLTEVTGVVLS
jgi:hypothetical protein